MAIDAVIAVAFAGLLLLDGAFIGTGLGYWDAFDGDHDTGSWILNFGVPVSQDKKWLVVGEGRLFFDSPDGIDNNYQMWGGVRYIFR